MMTFRQNRIFSLFPFQWFRFKSTIVPMISVIYRSSSSRSTTVGWTKCVLWFWQMSKQKHIQTNKLYRFHHPDSPHAAAAAVTSIMAWNVSSKKHPNQTTTKRRICRFGKQCCCRPQENVHSIEIIQQRAMLITVLSHAFYADTGTQLSLSLHPKIPNNKMQQTKILSKRKRKRKIILCREPSPSHYRFWHCKYSVEKFSVKLSLRSMWLHTKWWPKMQYIISTERCVCNGERCVSHLSIASFHYDEFHVITFPKRENKHCAAFGWARRKW